MEECHEATCFMVEQYISWNGLPSRMDKTFFEKTDKHKEWAEKKKIWNSFTPEEKALFINKLASGRPKDILDVKYFDELKKGKK